MVKWEKQNEFNFGKFICGKCLQDTYAASTLSSVKKLNARGVIFP
jgi:hypothetical protein